MRGSRLARPFSRQGPFPHDFGAYLPSISAAPSPMSRWKSASGASRAKVLTTPAAPERAVHRRDALGAAPRPGSRPPTVDSSSTARRSRPTRIIERKGAKTALVTTEGFRDAIEIRHENRFEQYDVNIDLPPPLVPRRLRFAVPERIDAHGDVLRAARRGRGRRAAPTALAAPSIESVAVGFLHSFTNPAHERAHRATSSPRGCPGCRSTLSLRGVAGDARIRALLDRLRQRLCPAADGALSRRLEARLRARAFAARCS